MAIKKITTVLLAGRIEPSIKFWEELGFEKTMDVPGLDGLAFAILQKDSIELMYQTYASVEAAEGGQKGFARGPTFLYVEVDSLDKTMHAVSATEILIPAHTTFYGSQEFGVKEPAGHIVTFAQFG